MYGFSQPLLTVLHMGKTDSGPASHLLIVAISSKLLPEFVSSGVSVPCSWLEWDMGHDLCGIPCKRRGELIMHENRN